MKRRTVDMFSPEERSRIMRAVKGSGTRAEQRLEALLQDLPCRFRCQAKDLPGCPDFVSDSLKLAIFLDGDFWHGRWWREEGAAPVANREYWIRKFERNRERDLAADRELRRMSWSVVRIWESDLLAAPSHVRARVRARVHRRARAANASRGG